jgi:immune inhibitor A
VLLPDTEKNVDIGDPAAGDHFYYSSAGPNLDNLMYQEVALPAGSPELTAQVRYAIETDWDYAYVVVSTDGGATWTGAETDHSTDTSPNGQNFGNGITGSTGGAWEPLTADLSQWAGQTVLVGFRYWTDGFENPMGFLVDEISIAGGPTLGAEADDGFTFDPAEGGFHVSDGAEISFHFNAYIAEFRQYRGYDESLKTGPYNFGFLDDPNLQNYVEHFPYMEGLLITYWDETFEDNNTGANCDAGRCGGLALPVDAHPTPMRQADGGYWRSRVQSYDSPFGLSATKKITVHENSQPSHHKSQPGNPVFDDTQSYWDPVIPWASVQVPGVGVTIRAGNSHGSYMWVYLNQ